MIVVNWEIYKNIENLPKVTDYKILKSNSQNQATEKGLYSEQIFGPKKNFKCQCGKLFSKINNGEICPNCNVECSSNTIRYKRFAAIELPPAIYVMNPRLIPFLNSMFGATPFKKISSISEYEKNFENPYFFNIKDAKLIRLQNLKKEESLLIDYPVYDIHSLRLLYFYLLKIYKKAKTKLIKLQILNEKIKESNVNKLESSKILEKFRTYYLKIHKIFSDCTHDDQMLDYVFLHHIPVTPPETRPLFRLNADKHNVHPISASYVEILKNKKNSEFDILFEQDPKLWSSVLFKYQKSVNLLYDQLNEEVFQKPKNVMREYITGKTIDHSQRSLIAPDPALHPNTVALCYESFHKLFQPFIKEYKLNMYQDNDTYNTTNFIRYIQEESLAKDGLVYLSDEELKDFLITYQRKLKVIIERAPVLYPLNTSGYHVSKVYPRWTGKGISDYLMMGVNTLEAEKFNFDFDGDTMFAIAVTSEEAQNEFHLYDSSNSKIFEHNGTIIASHEHEAIFAAFMLTQEPRLKLEENHISELIGTYKTYDEFKPNIRILNENPQNLVKIGDDELFYSVATLNKALNLNKTVIDNELLINKKILEKLDYEIYTYDEDRFYDNLHNFNKFLLECSSSVGYCSPTYESKDFDVYNEDIINYKKTLINEPFIGFHQNDILFNDYVLPEVEKSPRNILKNIYKSGAAIKSVQLLKAASNNGIPTDINGKGKAINAPQSLLEGKSEMEFYLESDSARLALAQRQDSIPKGGELQRKFYYQYGYLKQSYVEDCGCTRGLNIEVKNEVHLKSLEGRYYKESEEQTKWKIITLRKKQLIGTNIVLKSPHYCKSKNFTICKTCLGEMRPKSEQLGTKIGAYISESIIQSVLRTHHFSGAFITDIKKDLKDIMNKLEFQAPDFIKYSSKKDLDALENFMIKHYYKEGDFEFKKISNSKGKTKVQLIVHDLPYNDDAVKLLKNIINIIDVKRDGDELLTVEELYYQLCDNIVFPNGLYSYLVELILSMMYYDEDDKLIRYSDKEPTTQIAIKNIINSLDARLTIFYKLTNNSIYKILTTDNFQNVDHMYYDLLRYYK